MIQIKYALIAACLWLPFSYAQEIPRKESFSLKPILDGLGYGPYSSSVIPIESDQDIANAKEYFWPFETISASPNLSTVALGFDDRGFVPHSEIESTVVVVGLPDWPGRPLKELARYKVDPGARVHGLAYMSEHLLRVESMRGLEVDPLKMGYSYDYTFFDLTGDAAPYNLREDLGLKNVLYMRHFAESVYVIASDPSGKLDPEQIVFSVIKHDPLTQIATVLYSFMGNPVLGHELLHNPVNEPGRDVWVYGKDQVRIRFSHYERKHLEWQTMVLDVNGTQAELKLEQSDPRREGLIPIENTDEFFKSPSEEALVIYQEDDTGIRNPVYRDQDVTPWQQLTMVSGGFIGEERHLNSNRHFLYRANGERVLLAEERLIKSTQKDGGLVGVTNTDPRDGNINLVRVIYNREALVDAEVSGKETARDCTSLLLKKIMKKAKRK